MSDLIEALRAEVSHERWLREQAEDRCVAVEHQREALRADAARLRRSLHEAVVHGNRQSGRAERLAEALRKLLDVSDKFTGDKDEDAATWCAVNDAARAALHPTDTQE